MSEDALRKAVEAAREFSSNFVLKECKSRDDILALAVAITQQAEKIFLSVGGQSLAAGMFEEYVRRNSGSLN